MPNNLSYEPISRETVSSQIRSQLLRLITTGELPPGSQMPSERLLSEQFGVARTSVREAMQGLVSIGVVERKGNRSHVCENLPEVDFAAADNRKGFVRELFETRSVLEPSVFSLAAERADNRTRDRVASIAIEFGLDMEVDEFRRLDREFHLAIASGCANPLLIELYGKVLDRLFRSNEFAALLSDDLNQPEVAAILASSVKAHVGLAAAFEARDPIRMAQLASDHVDSVGQRMLSDLF